jgi:ribose 5-phosphate isomerase B
MRIALGCDHRGERAKERIREMLIGSGHEVKDFGPHGACQSDYPDSGFPAACCVRNGEADLGILFCGTGIGMSIVANKVRGIRAALCHDELSAQMSRRHNNANVLCLPADLIGEELMKRVVELWLHTDFEGGRHERRVNKILEYEGKEYGGGGISGGSQ